MTREDAKQLLPIIQAYIEGKQIQQLSNKWKDVNELSINCLLNNPELYRIKPEPKYYPFANAEECWNEMKKHQPFGWIMDENSYRSIAICDDKSIEVPLFVNNDSLISFKEAMDGYTFADGTPFGIKVE